MPERRVGIRVSVMGDTDPLRSLARNAAEANVAVRSIPNTVNVRANDNLDRLEQRARRAERSSSLLLDSVAMLAPAIAPVGAVGAAGLLGLTNQLGVATAAAGVAVIAFQGVGDALKAVDDFQNDPSASNLAKMGETLNKLGPEGQDFVMFLQRVRPELQQLQDAAQEGLFPGAADGIEDLLRKLPQAERLIGSLAAATGDMLADGGESFARGDWDEFFGMLERTGPSTLRDLGQSVGNLTKSAANLWVAFEPLNTDFSAGFVRATQRVEDFTAGLDETEGFAQFMDYVRENGSVLLDTIGSLANLGIQVGEAYAPLAGPTLKSISLIADALAEVADSPAGPALLGAAAGFAAINRALVIQTKLKDSLAGGLLFGGSKGAGGAAGIQAEVNARTSGLGKIRTAYREVAEAERGLADAQQRRASIASRTRDAQFALIPSGDKRAAVRDYSASLQGITAAEQRLTAAQRGRAAALRETAATAGRAAGPIAAIGLATSGLAEKSGLANTSTLALAGSMAGPYGAAAGAVVGVTLDVIAAYNKFIDTVEKAESSSTGNAGLTKRRADMKALYDETTKLASKGSFADELKAPFKDPTITARRGISLLTGDFDRANKAGAKLEQQIPALESNYSSLASRLGTPLPANASLAQIDSFAASVEPKLKQLGISVTQFANMNPRGIAQVSNQIRELTRASDSSAGRTRALRDSISGLDADFLSTADSASAFASALDALLSPNLKAEEATDAYRTKLRALREELNAGAGFKGESAGAVENRAATRDYVQSVQQMLVAQAEAGAGSEKLGRSLANARREFIAEGVAAKISRDVMIERANAMGLTPELVRTVFEAQGLNESAVRVRDFQAGLRGIPKALVTRIEAEGAPKSRAEVQALARQYNLTPKQVRTVAKLTNLATPELRKVLAGVKTVDRSKANPRITANTNKAVAQLRELRGQINSLRDKTVTIRTIRETVMRTRREAAQAANPAYARGGLISGPGGPMDDRILSWLSNREYVQRASAVSYYGVAFMDALNQRRIPKEWLPGFAQGGSVAQAYRAPAAVPSVSFRPSMTLQIPDGAGFEIPGLGPAIYRTSLAVAKQEAASAVARDNANKSMRVSVGASPWQG